MLRLSNANLKNCVFHFAMHSPCTIFAVINKGNEYGKDGI